jgi:hypothetical protein
MAPPGTKKARPPIRVENLTGEQTLVTAGWTADNHWTRRPRLIGDQPLAQEWTPQLPRRTVLNVPHGAETGPDPFVLWRG